MLLSVSFYQNEIEYSFKAEVSNTGLNVFTGTALNRMFDFVSCAKSVNAKTFKFSQPINLRIEVEGKKYDTGVCNEMLQSKLKLQRSDRGMKTFAKRTFELIKFSTSEVIEMSINDVLESFE